MITKIAYGATFAAALSLALAGCGRESDRASRADTPAPAGAQATDSSYARPQTAIEASAPRYEDGKPLWAANRQRSGQENAEKQFERNGKDFSAASTDDYVRKAHAFVDAPPKDALTATRSNGDVLYYDPKGNVFAVADRQGAPRTMFKPRDGMSYWLQQKQSAAQRVSSRGERRNRSASAEDASSDESAG